MAIQKCELTKNLPAPRFGHAICLEHYPGLRKLALGLEDMILRKSNDPKVSQKKSGTIQPSFCSFFGMVQNEAVLGNTTEVISGEYLMFLEGIGA